MRILLERHDLKIPASGPQGGSESLGQSGLHLWYSFKVPIAEVELEC